MGTGWLLTNYEISRHCKSKKREKGDVPHSQKVFIKKAYLLSKKERKKDQESLE